MYILLRSASVGDDEEDATANIQAHPVMAQLKNFNALLQKFEEQVHNKTEGIDKQLDDLVKAAALMGKSGDVETDEDGDDSSTAELLDTHDDEDEADLPEEHSGQTSDEANDVEGAPLAQDKEQDFRRILNEARFGLRPKEAKEPSKWVSKRRIGDMDDFGDLEEERSTSASRMLASTINTIEQRSQAASRKRRPAPVAETLDDLNEQDDQLAQGIKMMEEEMGQLGDDFDDDENNGEDMTDPGNDGESSNFYTAVAKQSKAKKSFRKSLYQAAPKFPRADGEVDGERAISRAILKNRGLSAHKAKINRNPRVKKREQYRKALIRRKGAVREVRQDEGHKYGGESTGIKSGISRSRKLK
jgi:U3 small nucleolar RNA-associated protein 3